MQTSHVVKVLKHFCGPIYKNKGSFDSTAFCIFKGKIPHYFQFSNFGQKPFSFSILAKI